MRIHSFADVLRQMEGLNPYLVLGNGFSIAVKPDIFTYASLFENADFKAAPQVPALFDVLGTQDFEIVIKHLIDTAHVLDVYRPDLPDLKAKLLADAGALKDALVQAIAKRHPSRPFEIAPEQYAACRAFLVRFRHVYTLNYDVLLYWALMQSEVDELALLPDDGFRHPEDKPNEPYVSWQAANSATVHYLHGALHLFDTGSDIIKYTWSKTDVPIVEQIRAALDQEHFPLFVAEGDSSSKKERILHNAYLHKALRSFEACCEQPRGTVTVFGHSLADNDAHILRLIADGKVPMLFVSVFGDPSTPGNQAIEKNALQLMADRERRRPRYPLEVTFFDAESAHVWG